MRERQNKPRVFLSHSKTDKEFIEQLHSDLMKAQIEPWLDTVEIRHGKPWLDQIFEEGIPACDCIFIYFTEHSIASGMVKKELDAAVLRTLSDNKVTLLPYVNNESLRSKLRADIQALQVPALHSDNYHAVLPRIVAEVWRSYMERKISFAVQNEKVRRLEAELELEELRKVSGNGIFTESEERDFDYIYQRLNRYEVVEAEGYKKGEGGRELVKAMQFEVSVLSILAMITVSGYNEYSDSTVSDKISKGIGFYVSENSLEINAITMKRCPKLADELLMYGFVQREIREQPKRDLPGFRSLRVLVGNPHHFVYTSRVERFKYWLAVKDKLPTELIWAEKAAP